jgi:hypothetical protein
MAFLSQFKRFMKMNRDADIAKDPFKRCNYFLSLLDGPDTEGWVRQQDDWLDKVEEDRNLLPWLHNEWMVMEAEFKKAFIDYAEHERANDELRKLRMKDGNIDAYIARFSQLAYQGGHDKDEPEITRLFAMGLPQALANVCLEQSDPDTFEEWAHAAQRNHRIFLKKQSLKGVFDNAQQRNPQRRQGNNPFANFQWRNRGGRGGGRSNPRTTRDPDAMDTSATIRKAVTEADKQRFRQEGRCFECGKRGHLVRDCPDRPVRAKATSSRNDDPPRYGDLEKGGNLAELALKLTEAERDTFIKKVMAYEPEEDFLPA